MAFDLEEQEQLESLKMFWARWGLLIKSISILVLLVLVGWKSYGFYQKNQSEKAQAAYELFDLAQQKKDASAAELLAALQQKHTKTRFAALASFDVAAAAMADKKWDQATTSLQWVIDHSFPENQGVARLHLADLMVQLDKNDEAIKILEKLPSPNFTAAFANKSADVYLMMKDYTKAATAVDEAIAFIEAQEVKDEQLLLALKEKKSLIPQ